MLILAPNKFTNFSSNFTGTPNVSAPGTNFTAGANNADGSAVSVIAAVPHDIHWLVVAIGGIQASNVDTRCLVDVLQDPAGGSSWASLIDDLVAGWSTPPTGTVGLKVYYYFPLWIKSGTSLGVRARTSHTSNITTGRIAIWAFGNPSRPDQWWCGQKVETLGVTASTSSGTDVTPGASGTYGSWTNIGATTGGRYGFLQFGANGTDSAAQGKQYHFELGASSSRFAGTPRLHLAVDVSENMTITGQQPIWCDIPQGTQLQARATCNTTSPENIDVAYYGVY